MQSHYANPTSLHTFYIDAQYACRTPPLTACVSHPSPDVVRACVRQVGSTSGALIVASAAVAANTFESVLGASVQGRVGWLTNDVVNVIQITLAAALAVLAGAMLGTS